MGKVLYPYFYYQIPELIPDLTVMLALAPKDSLYRTLLPMALESFLSVDGRGVGVVEDQGGDRAALLDTSSADGANTKEAGDNT